MGEDRAIRSLPDATALNIVLQGTGYKVVKQDVSFRPPSMQAFKIIPIFVYENRR
jgi:hypothetical protein